MLDLPPWIDAAQVACVLRIKPSAVRSLAARHGWHKRPAPGTRANLYRTSDVWTTLEQRATCRPKPPGRPRT